MLKNFFRGGEIGKFVQATYSLTFVDKDMTGGKICYILTFAGKAGKENRLERWSPESFSGYSLTFVGQSSRENRLEHLSPESLFRL
jgi:hypothetical protein